MLINPGLNAAVDPIIARIHELVATFYFWLWTVKYRFSWARACGRFRKTWACDGRRVSVSGSVCRAATTPPRYSSQGTCSPRVVRATRPPLPATRREAWSC